MGRAAALRAYNCSFYYIAYAPFVIIGISRLIERGIIGRRRSRSSHAQQITTMIVFWHLILR